MVHIPNTNLIVIIQAVADAEVAYDNIYYINYETGLT